MKELILIAGCLAVVSAILAAMGYKGREQVVGIDLGTTFSVVAVKSKDEVTIVPDYLSGKPLLPSVVTFLPNGSAVVVGDLAVSLRDRFPRHTVFNAKRFIGRPLSEVADDAASHPFRVTANSSTRAEGGDAGAAMAGFTIPMDDGKGDAADRWLSPVDVGAELVRHMKQSIAVYMGYPIHRAVICVPAKFTYRETKATQEAFEQAGIKVMRVLEEPTAAAVAYNLHKVSGVRHVLVYDIGGGTLDTSLLYMNGRSVNVLGVAGDDHLGGSDFDRRMADLLKEKLVTATRASPPDGVWPIHDCDRNGLYIAAEKAKIQLSSQLSLDVYCREKDGGFLRLAVTRDEFEQASEDLFNRAMAPVEQVLADQMMTVDNIDDLVLVGGASRTPRLRVLLQEFLGASKRLHTEIDPDVTVAYGAANILD